MDRVFDKFKDTIKFDKKVMPYSEAKEEEKVLDIVNHQLKMPHK